MAEPMAQARPALKRRKLKQHDNTSPSGLCIRVAPEAIPSQLRFCPTRIIR